jgi:parallel beta-helix repeat protein
LNKSIIIPTIITISFFLIYVILSIIFSFPTFSKEINVLTVDVNGRGDYISIADAINNASDGDVIRIWDGTYIESNITISKSLVIIGNSSTSTIIDCNSGHGLKLLVSNINIASISIINTKNYGIYVSDAATYSNLSDIRIVTIDGDGIIVGASYVVIARSNITSKTPYENGILLQAGHCKVVDCRVSGYANGIQLIFSKSRSNVVSSNYIFNNSASGIDIRIGANNNTISYCNINSNLYGIYIQESSNDNIFHHNNLINNGKNAIDRCKNQWYKDKTGNYWSDYTGFDSNLDGIGDTPYDIPGGGNKDVYPLMTAVGSNNPSTPTSVKCITTETDNTPTFEWNPSYHVNGIKTYYVKIDNNPEIPVGNVLNWTSNTIIPDGTHVFYVRAESIDGTSSGYGSCIFTVSTSKIDSDNDGWTDKEEEKYGTDPNNPYDYPMDTDNDHIPDVEDNDNDNDGYNDEMETSYGTNPFDPNSYPYDTDNDGIPNDDSPDKKYTGDVDDDNDELSDENEIAIGTNPRWKKDVERITIKGKNFYLVDLTNDTIYDALYNPISANFTDIAKKGENYLLDIDGDGEWEYIFETTDKTLSSYKSQKQDFLTIILLLVIPFSVIPIFIFLRKKKLKIHPVSDHVEIKDKGEDFRNLINELRERFADYKEDITTISSSKSLDVCNYEKKTKDISEIEEEIDKLISYKGFTYKKKRRKSND